MTELMRSTKSSMEAMNNTESYAFKGNLNFNLINDTEEEFSLAMEFNASISCVSISPVSALAMTGENFVHSAVEYTMVLSGLSRQLS